MILWIDAKHCQRFRSYIWMCQTTGLDYRPYAIALIECFNIVSKHLEMKLVCWKFLLTMSFSSCSSRSVSPVSATLLKPFEALSPPAQKLEFEIENCKSPMSEENNHKTVAISIHYWFPYLCVAPIISPNRAPNSLFGKFLGCVCFDHRPSNDN